MEPYYCALSPHFCLLNCPSKPSYGVEASTPCSCGGYPRYCSADGVLQSCGRSHPISTTPRSTAETSWTTPPSTTLVQLVLTHSTRRRQRSSALLLGVPWQGQVAHTDAVGPRGHCAASDRSTKWRRPRAAPDVAGNGALTVHTHSIKSVTVPPKHARLLICLAIVTVLQSMHSFSA